MNGAEIGERHSDSEKFENSKFHCIPANTHIEPAKRYVFMNIDQMQTNRFPTNSRTQLAKTWLNLVSHFFLHKGSVHLHKLDIGSVKN